MCLNPLRCIGRWHSLCPVEVVSALFWFGGAFAEVSICPKLATIECFGEMAQQKHYRWRHPAHREFASDYGVHAVPWLYPYTMADRSSRSSPFCTVLLVAVAPYRSLYLALLRATRSTCLPHHSFWGRAPHSFLLSCCFLLLLLPRLAILVLTIHTMRWIPSTKASRSLTASTFSM